MRLRRSSAAQVAAAAYVTILLGKGLLAARRLRTAPRGRPVRTGELARCVVAQPILSGDRDLPNALLDNAAALRGARVVWLVDDTDPTGAQVAREAAALAPPGARIEVVPCAPAPERTNPKLWKLQLVLDRCGDDEVLVVLDDDTRLPTASLAALLDGLAGATVATGLPAYLPGDGPWAGLVTQFVANNSVHTYLTGEPITLNGMTYAVRGGDLRAMGGFEPVLGSLTDDLAVAGLVQHHGGRIVQTAAPQWITTDIAGPARYVALLHRWMLFATILLQRQPLTVRTRIAALHGIPPAMLWIVLAGARRHPLTALGVVTLRSGMLILLQRCVIGRVLHRPVLSLLSELAQPVHIAHAVLRRDIVWRSRRYRVVSDTDFRDLSASGGER